MEKTKFEEMFDRLPSNVKDSEVLRIESKKILAALLELLLHSEAKNSGIIYVGNGKLRRLSGVGSDNLLSGIQQLEDYELVTRIKGSVRKVQTEKGQASEYRINFKKLKEPIVEKTFDDLFSEFLEDEESLEKPISTTITTTITTSTTTSNTTANTITTSNTNTTAKSNTVDVNNMSKFEELERFVDNCFNNKKTYQEMVSQVAPILDWIHERYSDGSNVEQLQNHANELINEKLSTIPSSVNIITTEAVQVEDKLPF